MPGVGGPVPTFSRGDYAMFNFSILGVLVIGLYLALRGRKVFDCYEFFLGGQKMKAFPTALSLAASFMSGITVINTPSEAYHSGSAFWLFGFAYAFSSAITAEVFLPVFYRLKITSCYEYLEMRFDRQVRVVGAFVYIIQTVVYTGLVMYAPALALNQVTGMNLWGPMVTTGAVCIVYCTLGGLKAVVWTDVLQFWIMVLGFLIIIIHGSVIQGGLNKIWADAGEGGRLYAFDFDPSPLRRHTFWTIIVGGTVMWLSIYAINQSQVQRYVSCETLQVAKMALYMNVVSLLVIVSFAVISGLAAYSVYKNCDPFTNGDITSWDQLMPYFVMDTMADYPGLPGLFVAAAYGGTLSTVSSSINSLVAVAVIDFVYPVSTNFTTLQMIWINMGLSVFFGAVCIGMAAVASVIGGLLQAALSLFGVINGPLLGLYVLGMFFRSANSKGGLAGLFCGLFVTMWVWIGGLANPTLKEKVILLSVSTAKCNNTGSNNFTVSSQSNEEPAHIYSLSYLYLSVLGVFTTVSVGLLVSIATGREKRNLRSELFVQKEDFICYSYYHRSKVRVEPDSESI